MQHKKYLVLAIFITSTTYSTCALSLCERLYQRLYTCQPYTCRQINPLFPITIIKHEVIGLKDNICEYQQKNVTSNMTCYYSQATRDKIVNLMTQVTNEYQELIHNTIYDLFPETEAKIIKTEPKIPMILNTDELTAECQVESLNVLNDIDNIRPWTIE